MGNKKENLLGLGMIACLLVMGGVAQAESDPENVIKYRQSTMKALGGHMGASAQIVRGKVVYPNHLVFHAEAIGAISRRVADLFPEGSDFGDTETKAAVWEKPEAFAQAATKAETSAADYLAAVRNGDQAAIRESFRSLSEACKGCHKEFREKDD